MSELDDFRAEARDWLASNCPPGARGPGEVSSGGSKAPVQDPDTRLWMERMVEKGWTVPGWPKEYGGAGLSKDEQLALAQEMKRIGARPALHGIGTLMVGPALLEFGSDDQKARHLPRIARCEVAWCQGYSEPGAGSDLASLQTQAALQGDHYVINGSKIWTSLAQTADWMFLLARTDRNAPKHEGISFLLLPMDQPGVEVAPIRLISGESFFNQVFFTDARAAKEDLVGEPNRGWTVGKRVLQHERSGLPALLEGSVETGRSNLGELAKRYLGEADGKVADAALRMRIVAYDMAERALNLTRRRTLEESAEAATPGPATSIFKMVGTDLEKLHYDLATRLRGHQGFGWEGAGFAEDELEDLRQLLYTRAASIHSGSNEIQRNIIAKRVLGLPD